jgi:hypothetical protein
MAKKPKVYCRECAYLHMGPSVYLCDAPSNWHVIDTWYGQEDQRKSGPKVINKHNKCQLYKEREDGRT